MKKLIITIITIIGAVCNLNGFSYENLIGSIVEHNGCLYQCIDDYVGYEEQVGACLIFPPTGFMYPEEVTIADSVEIDGKILPVIYIQNSAFCNHAEVRKVTFGANILQIGTGAFYLSKIEDVILNDKLASVGQQAFGQCENLKSIILPSNVYLDQGAFVNTNLLAVHIKRGVACSMGSLFCRSMESLTFEDGATGIRDIGYYEGFYAGQVTELNFPGSIIIETKSFRGVPNLKKVALQVITDDRSRVVIASNGFNADAPLEEFVSYDPVPPLVADDMLSEAQFAACVLRVPEGCADAYKAAQGWKNFANISEIASAPDAEVSAVEVVSTEYYDMTGRKISSPQRGTFCIERALMSDGSVRITKTLR